jgi:hypothetical protein
MRRSTELNLLLQLGFPGEHINCEIQHFSQEGILMRRSTVLGLPLQLGFPGEFFSQGVQTRYHPTFPSALLKWLVSQIF